MTALIPITSRHEFERLAQAFRSRLKDRKFRQELARRAFEVADGVDFALTIERNARASGLLLNSVHADTEFASSKFYEALNRVDNWRHAVTFDPRGVEGCQIEPFNLVQRGDEYFGQINLTDLVSLDTLLRDVDFSLLSAFVIGAGLYDVSHVLLKKKPLFVGTKWKAA